MTNECVVGVFESIAQAEQAFHMLERAGVPAARMSLVTRHIDPGGELGKELSLGDDSLRDAAVGATLGGLAGVVTNAAVFFVTGVGAFVVAGPLVAATGAVVGAFLGAMDGWGVHQSHIRKYEKLVHQGRVLLAINGDPEELAAVDRMLRQTAAFEVHLHAASSADDAEIDDRPSA